MLSRPTLEPEQEEETSAAEEWARYGMAAGYVSAGGMQVVIGALIGYFAGRFLDQKLGWNGVVALGLAIVGFVAGLYQMWRTIQALQKRTERRTKKPS